MPSGDFFQHIGSAAGKELKKEMGNMNILFELPKGNTLREQLQDLKSEMKSMFDKFLASRNTFIFVLYLPNNPARNLLGSKLSPFDPFLLWLTLSG